MTLTLRGTQENNLTMISSHRAVFSLRLLACWLGFAALPLLADTPEWHTLTDSQGRTIRAQIVSVTDDDVTVTREDKQTFTLKLAQLSKTDQEELRAYAKANPPLLPATALEMQMNRGKFGSTVTKKTITLTSGKIVKDGLHITTEEWGYSLLLKNRTNYEIKDARLDYVLYAQKDEFGVMRSSDKKLVGKRYQTKLDPIPMFGQIDTRTDTIRVIKQEYQGGIYRAGTNHESRTRDKLYGVWLRVYVGKQLLIEEASPPGLATSEQWPD